MRFIFSVILFSLLISGPLSYAQTFSVSSTGAFSNTNTVTDVTFNFQNTNSYPVKITSIEGVMATAGVTNVALWYRSTPLSASAPPGAISVANGWTLQVSTTVTAIANTSTTNTQPLFSNLSLQIPAGATYAFAISAYISTSTSNQRCFAMTAPFLPLSTFTQSGCSIITGDNISFSGGVPPAVPSITSRGWIGKLIFESAAACTNPPNPGTVSSTVPTTCFNSNFTLSIIGSSLGAGQSIQWQSSNDNISWSNITGGTTSPFTTSQTTSKYYKCIVTCGTSAETPSFYLPINHAPFAGAYTVNQTQATGGTNFNSLSEFANTITCAGVSGPVTVDVVAGSGPYIEQVVFGSIPGSSATNTISINGNGNTLTYTGTAASPYTLGLNGSDYISISNLNVVGLNTTNVIAGHLWNGANNNTFTNCSFSVPQSATALSSSAFSISSSEVNPNSASNPSGFGGKNNILQSCTASGGYYCVIIDGSSGNADSNNQVINCTISDFERLGLTSDYNINLVARGNTVERLNRTSLGNAYVGMLISVGCAGSTIEKNIFRNPFANDTTSTQLATGIQCSATGLAAFENKFYNNLIYNFKNNGTQTGFNMFGADYYAIYHNTISFDYTIPVTETTHGIYCSGNTGSKKIRNNIVSIKRAGTGLKTCLYYAVTGGTILSNNNLLYVVSGGNIGYRTNYSTTLAQWQADPGGSFDAQSISVDPLFSSPSTGNYYPTNSLSDNKGAPVGILTDLIGVTRSTLAPDVGVYEYTLCTNLNGGSISPGNIAKCVGQTYTITATGVSVGSGITLQWQLASALGGAYADISGASNSSYIPAVSNSGIYYYRLKTTCSLNVANPVFSNEFTFTVNALPTVTITPFIASICIPYVSPVSLQASGGLTYAWTPATSLSATTGATVSSTSLTAMVYTVTATNANSCSNTSSVSLVPYARPVVTVSSSSNNICRGNTIQLNSQSVCYKDVLRITEITQSKTGLGATSTYPSYIVSGPDDFIEISNLSNVPINAQGLVVEMWSGSSLYKSFTIPAGTIIPANGVAVFANGIGTNSISNRYFFMEPQSSVNLAYNNSMGYVLRQFGSVIDAVGVYGYSFPLATGVTSADWSGSLTSTTGAAGLIRSAAIDNNTSSNWSFSSASLLQTIGTYNSVAYTLPTASCNYNYLWSATNPLNNFSSIPPLTPSINVVCQQNDTYTLNATGDGGCQSSASATVNVTSCPTPLQLKLFIQGYYKSSSNMRPVLYNDGLSIDATDCDSIVVFLHQALSPFQIVDSVHTILQTNGTALCHFTDRVGLFYISVRSRNAIETWSSMPFQLSNNGSVYDFTSSSTQAYANNMKQVENGIWAFYSGDINADGNIDNADYVLLMNTIDDFMYGYQTADLDGDGNVDLLDLPVLEQNLIQFISSEFPN